MTNEEAIKELKLVAEMYGHNWIKDACAVAVEALEKQIPNPYNEGYNRSWGVSKKVKVCPTCDCFIDEVHFIDADDKKRPHIAYCGHCGQAVDYDEEATE